MMGFAGLTLFMFCTIFGLFILICDPLDFERDIRGRTKPVVKSKATLDHEIMVMEHELDIMGHHLDCSYCAIESVEVERQIKHDEQELQKKERREALYLDAERNPQNYEWESIQEMNASGEIVCTYTYPTPITCVTCGKIGIHTHTIAV